LGVERRRKEEGKRKYKKAKKEDGSHKQYDPIKPNLGQGVRGGLSSPKKEKMGSGKD